MIYDYLTLRSVMLVLLVPFSIRQFPMTVGNHKRFSAPVMLTMLRKDKNLEARQNLVAGLKFTSLIK